MNSRNPKALSFRFSTLQVRPQQSWTEDQPISSNHSRAKSDSRSRVTVKSAFFVLQVIKRFKREMSHAQLDLTPYEKFVRQNLEDEKKRLDQLNEQYVKAGFLKKIQIKRELDQLNQNILQLSADLKNYESGLSWLREPSEERDETAESLKPVPIEAITAQAPKPAAPVVGQARPAPTVGTRAPSSAPPVGRPVVGQPSTSQPSVQQSGSSVPQAPRVGAPVVGKPVGTSVAKPAPAQPQQAQTTTSTQTTKPQAPRIGSPIEDKSVGSPPQAPRVGTPVVGKPVGAPVVGTPVGTSVAKPEATQSQQQPPTTQSGNQAAKPQAPRIGAPIVGKPLQAPRVGTPIATRSPQPKKAQTEEEPFEEKKSDAENESTSS